MDIMGHPTFQAKIDSFEKYPSMNQVLCPDGMIDALTRVKELALSDILKPVKTLKTVLA